MQGLLDVKKKAAGRKRGPKPKPPEQVRSVPVTFFVTPEEKEIITQAADLKALPGGISALLRGRVLPYCRKIVEQAGE